MQPAATLKSHSALACLGRCMVGVALCAALMACTTPMDGRASPTTMANKPDAGLSDAWMCQDPFHRPRVAEAAPAPENPPSNMLTRLWVATQEMAIAALAQVSLLHTPFDIAPVQPEVTPDPPPLLGQYDLQLVVGQRQPAAQWPQCTRWLTWSALN
jgi:hypothetical protein